MERCLPWTAISMPRISHSSLHLNCYIFPLDQSLQYILARPLYIGHMVEAHYLASVSIMRLSYIPRSLWCPIAVRHAGVCPSVQRGCYTCALVWGSSWPLSRLGCPDCWKVALGHWPGLLGRVGILLYVRHFPCGWVV